MTGAFGIFLLIPEITDQTDILEPPADRQDRRSNCQRRAGRRAELRRAGARKGFWGETTTKIAFFFEFLVRKS